MASSKGASVVVIGGGVTGLSAAWWLARSGAAVTVLDKGVIGWEASSRNGGGASHYQSPLFEEEQRLWPMMDELLGYPTEFRRERILIATTEHHLHHYHYIADMCGEMGHRVDKLDVQQAREMVPLAGDNCLGGVHYRFGGHANPQRSVQAYAWALQDFGGRILQHCPALAIETEGGRATGVRTPQGIIGCDALVVAAGPQITGLMAPLGIEVPLAQARAEMIVTEPAPLMSIGGVDGNGLYGRQTLRGNLAYGGGPHEWLDTDAAGPAARPSTPLARSLARRVAELLPKAAHLNVIRSWAGIVENTPDGRPIIDRLENPGNVVIATMSGVGFGLSRFAGLPADWRTRRGWDAISRAA